MSVTVALICGAVFVVGVATGYNVVAGEAEKAEQEKQKRAKAISDLQNEHYMCNVIINNYVSLRTELTNAETDLNNATSWFSSGGYSYDSVPLAYSEIRDCITKIGKSVESVNVIISDFRIERDCIEKELNKMNVYLSGGSWVDYGA